MTTRILMQNVHKAAKINLKEPRYIIRSLHVILFAVAVASPPSFLRGRLQSAAPMCVRPWREIMPARYLRECADDCEEKRARRRYRVRCTRKDGSGRRAAICFTVSRVRIADRPANRSAQPRASVVLRSKVAPARLLSAPRGKNVASEKCGRTTRRGFITRAVFHSAVLSASRPIYRIGRNGADEYSSSLI